MAPISAKAQTMSSKSRNLEGVCRHAALR